MLCEDISIDDTDVNLEENAMNTNVQADDIKSAENYCNSCNLFLKDSDDLVVHVDNDSTHLRASLCLSCFV